MRPGITKSVVKFFATRRAKNAEIQRKAMPPQHRRDITADSIECAVHLREISQVTHTFALPSDGSLLDDADLRALSESETLSLPFPVVSLEYNTSAGDRHAVVLRQSNSHIFVTDFRDTDGNGYFWAPQQCRVPRSHWFTDRAVSANDILDDEDYQFKAGYNVEFASGGKGEDGSPLWVSVPHRIEDRETHFACDVAVKFLNALACANVNVERAPRTADIKPALPHDTYHILVVSGRRQRSSDPNGAGETFERRQSREHVRRGHIRRRFGKTFWVNASIVNRGKGGCVVKDYAVVS